MSEDRERERERSVVDTAAFREEEEDKPREKGPLIRSLIRGCVIKKKRGIFRGENQNQFRVGNIPGIMVAFFSVTEER